jgi:hypothetical protein
VIRNPPLASVFRRRVAAQQQETEDRRCSH